MVDLDKLQIQPMQADHLSSVLEIENVSFQLLGHTGHIGKSHGTILPITL